MKFKALLLLVIIFLNGHSKKLFAQEEQPDMYILPDKEKVLRLMNQEDLFTQGQKRIYEGEHLEEISFPVGGIGSGLIQMNGKAELKVWQIFNNYGLTELPHSFYAIRTSDSNGKTVVRALQTAAVDGFKPLESLSFSGEYPFGWFNFKDNSLPVDVQLEVFNPLIPNKPRESAIPCAIFTYTVSNPTDDQVKVSLLASQLNAAGFDVNPLDERWNRRSKFTEVINEPGKTTLHMITGRPLQAPGYGDMTLTVLNGSAFGIADIGSPDSIADKFTADDNLKGPLRANIDRSRGFLTGALVAPFVLAPGETRKVTFILTWYFPNVNYEWGSSGGNMYENWYENSMDVNRDVEKRLTMLTEETKRYHETIYASNLPRWMIDRITSQVTSLRSRTVFWGEDGYLGGWEGVFEKRRTGSCMGNCSHVWHYAQSHAFLFPELARKFRDEALAAMYADGGIPFRQGHYSHPVATDGQLGEILGAYREYLMSPDTEWLESHWAEIRKAMDFAIKTWDMDEDGVLSGEQNNTLDSHTTGCSSWLGSMYLTALKACEAMSGVMNDKVSAEKYAKIWSSGTTKQNELLWNGEYYIQVAGKELKNTKNYKNGCIIDQVLGVWWAELLNLPSPYPEDRVKTALQSLFKYNFYPDFHNKSIETRRFVENDDAGMVMITWPHNDQPENSTPLWDDIMTGFEYAAAASMIQAGLLKEGFTVTKAVYDRYTGISKKGMQARRNSGNPFADDETGRWYARAMSNWSLLLACQGYIYNGPENVIGFNPEWKPENHISFFTSPSGYGLFRQVQSSDGMKANIELKDGVLDIKKICLAIPEGYNIKSSLVEIGKEQLTSRVIQDGNIITFELDEPLTLEEENAVSVSIYW